VLKSVFVGIFFAVPLPSGLFISAAVMCTTYLTDIYSLACRYCHSESFYFLPSSSLFCPTLSYPVLPCTVIYVLYCRVWYYFFLFYWRSTYKNKCNLVSLMQYRLLQFPYCFVSEDGVLLPWWTILWAS
jgi:hypothetical protein